ncbi:MAG: condensation domain-containing protein, partial [Blastocatellia bacterium]
VLTTYECLAESGLPEPAAEAPYKRYVQWLKRQDSGLAKKHWERVLREVNPQAFPRELKPAANVDGAGRAAEARIKLDGSVLQSLREFSASSNVTISTVLESAWAILLSRFLGTDDVVYGRVVSGRPADLPEVETTIGLFINTLPARIVIRGAWPVKLFVQTLQAAVVEDREFEYSSLTNIRQWCGIEKSGPLFESIFAFENYPMDASVEAWIRGSGKGAKLKNLRSVESTNYPLALIAVPADGVTVRLAYDRARFDRVTVHRMLTAFECILQDIIASPERFVGEVTCQTPAEAHQALSEWNDSASLYPEESLVCDLFQAQSDRTPNAIAVQHDGEHVTYTTLSGRSNGVAHHLQAADVQVGDCVAVSFDRGIEMIVAMVAVAKAGAWYLPVDPSLPLERVLAMLRDSKASVLLTAEQHAGKFSSISECAVCAINEVRSADFGPDLGLLSGSARILPLYTIYTSGSTGEPKGVWVPHGAVVRLVVNTNYVTFDSSSVVAHSSPASFDAATFEVWGALLAGARVVVIDKEAMLS